MEVDLQLEDEATSEEPKRKFKPKVVWRNTEKYWSGFCRQTPIDGIKYLDYERPLYERLWWTVLLIVFMYLAYEYCLQLWYRLLEEPEVNQMETRTGYDDVVNIPLPAVIFCDNMKSSGRLTNEMTSFLCGQAFKEETNQNHTLDIDLLFEMAPLFNATCTILVHDESAVSDESHYFNKCEQMFTRILTQHGVCYSFNMLDVEEIFSDQTKSYHSSHGRRSDWHPEHGYRKDAHLVDKYNTKDPLKEGTYPKRAVVWEVSFNISLGTQEGGTFCAGDKPGLNLGVHNPANFPRMGHRNNEWFPVQKEEDSNKYDHYVDLEVGNEYAMTLDPELNWSNENLKDVAPRKRNCYYHDERKLLYFNYYSKTNCDNECLINITMWTCGCVDFYMPYTDGVKLCDKQMFPCVMLAVELWRTEGKKECSCYSSCKELNYNTDLYYKRKTNRNIRHHEENMIRLLLFMTDGRYKTIEHRKLEKEYLLVDFLANCGGIFGLFCGVSVISIIDFVYYSSIRLMTNFWWKRKNKENTEQTTTHPS